jgi:RimJ/RimL family protein N-acetyltransferase
MPLNKDHYGTRLPRTFLSGKQIDLRALTEDDALSTDWFDWFNDELVCQTLQKHVFPNDPNSQVEFFRGIQKDRSIIQLGIMPKDSEKLIGVVSLSRIHCVNRNAEFSIVIGDPEQQRQNHSLEALKLLYEHGFYTMNLHKIYGGSLESLVGWLETIKKVFGFKDEGVWREHVFKDGRYMDVHRVGLLRKDFKKLMQDWKGV